ncbi:hypothetical protein JK358_34275 [Nocardia sp. 2]|uniref:Endonuclease n=1 Tax=Nocardia acididurans TaxID=2802282 RepID=A0ABS1MHH2_9NOCA|nr:hypothetical protein [Nocardia acididurans]MBL1079485.1 hypothetical protein [Nocardia acididurans]
MSERHEQVYLLHFDQKYRHAGHYIGTTRDLQARLQAHADGRGARLLQVLKEHGIGWHLARTWDGGRALERELKGFKNAARLCPDCSYTRDHDRPRPTNAFAAAAAADQGQDRQGWER